MASPAKRFQVVLSVIWAHTKSHAFASSVVLVIDIKTFAPFLYMLCICHSAARALLVFDELIGIEIKATVADGLAIDQSGPFVCTPSFAIVFCQFFFVLECVLLIRLCLTFLATRVTMKVKPSFLKEFRPAFSFATFDNAFHK